MEMCWKGGDDLEDLSIIVVMIIFWGISSFFKKAGKEKAGDSPQKKKFHFDDLENVLKQFEKGNWPTMGWEEEPPQEESFTKSAEESAKVFHAQETETMPQRRWANPIGSLGRTIEGEDVCDPALGHGRMQGKSFSMPEDVLETVNPLPLPLNRETLVQSVVMSEVLMQPAWQKRRRMP